MPDDLLTQRESLDKICKVPDKIISVYSLEKHVWADSNSLKARQARQPELKTVSEFEFDPVRPFVTDVLRRIAAPYDPNRKENPIGQGYWIQAEFGSGKSHLLCTLGALALGKKEAWDIVQAKEQKAKRGKRESLYQFWEEGIEAKSSKSNKGIFIIVKTLVGTGSGTVGIEDKGRKLTEYILEAAKEQLIAETGKNLSLYPAETQDNQGLILCLGPLQHIFELPDEDRIWVRQEQVEVPEQDDGLLLQFLDGQQRLQRVVGLPGLTVLRVNQAIHNAPEMKAVV